MPGIKNIKLVLIFLAIIFANQNLFAQNECSVKLQKATELYNEGIYNQVLDILLKSVESCNYSKTELEEAEKLIIASYLELDEVEKGNEQALKFLRKRPNYIINRSSDPLLFVREIETYKIEPKFKVSLHAGINKPSTNILTSNTIWESADYSKPYINDLKFQALIAVEWYVLSKFSIKLGGQFSSQGYERDITAHNNFLLIYNESYTELKFPLQLYYHLNIYNKWSLLFTSGLYYSTIINPIANFTLSDINNETLVPFNEELKAVSTKSFRNLQNYGYIFGVGLNYVFNRFSVSFETNYSADLKSFVSSNTDVIEYSPTLNYYYIDDYFKFRNINFLIGISYAFSYKIHKKY